MAEPAFRCNSMKIVKNLIFWLALDVFFYYVVALTLTRILNDHNKKYCRESQCFNWNG
jgi:hypothetical protein